MDRGVKLGLVTALTLIRFPLVLLFFVGALLHAWRPSPWLFVLSFGSVIASAATDLFDGYLARKFEVTTSFGAHVDPLMDKFFYLATLPLLVFLAAIRNGHIFHAAGLLVVTMLFLMRDQWVTFLRSIGSMYNVSGKAHWSGKLRTVVSFPLICGLYHFLASPWPLFPSWLVYTFEVIATAINLISISEYTRRYWPYLRKSASLHH